MVKKESTINWKQWGLIFGGIVLIGLGVVFGMFIYPHARTNPLVAFLMLIILTGGGYSIYYGIKVGRESRGGAEVNLPEIDKAKRKELEKNANSLNIYAYRDEDGFVHPVKIVFEIMHNPEGPLYQWIGAGSDNKWYHVHIWDVDKKRLVPFILPDRQYFDPREFANVVMAKEIRDVFTPEPSLAKTIGAGILALMFGVTIFGLIAVGG